MYLRSFLVLFTAVLLITSGCKKESPAPSGPSIYNFTVVDDTTGLPVPYAKAVLQHVSWPASYTSTELGFADVNGKFAYTCDKTSIHTAGNYSYYRVYFILHDDPLPGSSSGAIEVTQTHETQNYTFEIQ